MQIKFQQKSTGSLGLRSFTIFSIKNSKSQIKFKFIDLFNHMYIIIRPILVLLSTGSK